MSSRPEPVMMAVCTVCGEPWYLHLRYAKYRMDADRDDDDDYPYIEATDADVTLEECVDALRQRNRGPMGPPGPMGPMGMSAK